MTNPAPARDPRRPARGDAGWPAARPRGPPAVRDRRLRREQHRGDRGHPHRSGRIAGTPTRSSPTGSRPTGSAPAPTGHRARRRRPSRSNSSSTSSPRRLDIDPIELRRRNLVAPDDEMADGTPWGGLGLGECLDRIAAHPLWRDRASLPDGEGVGRGRRGVAGHAAAGGRHLPARGRRTGHRRDRRGRHLGLDDRVRDDRRGGPRHRGRRGVGHRRRHRCRAALADERRERHHLLDRPGGPARHRRAARQDPGLRGPAPRDRRPGPRARRRRRPAEGHARARPDPGPDRGVARRVHLGVRAARGPRRDGPAGPGAVDVRPPRPRPGRSRDRIGRGRRVRHRPGRRSRPQSGHHRGPAPRRRDPGTRLGAPRGDGLRRRRPAPDRDLPRLRAPDGADGARVRDDHRRGPGTGRPVRGEGDRRGPGVRCGGGRGQRRDATRPVSASGSCR